MTYTYFKVYVMQSKLTLRVEDSIVRKAKRVACAQGTSVSKLFSQYISSAHEEDVSELAPLTAGMLGVLQGADEEVSREDYREHLERKHL